MPLRWILQIASDRHEFTGKAPSWGGSRGGSGGSVEPPKLKLQTSKNVRFLKEITNKYKNPFKVIRICLLDIKNAKQH